MSTLLSSISEFFAALFGRAARPYPGLSASRGLDAPVNDAAAYGVSIEEAKPTSGQLYWKVQRVHHLTADENNFRALLSGSSTLNTLSTTPVKCLSGYESVVISAW